MTISDTSSLSRRLVVGGAGLGLAAGTLPAAAQAPARPGLQDPATRYPRPPYKKQSQPWPGLASQMDPAPDHGETSYRGSGRLTAGAP